LREILTQVFFKFLYKLRATQLRSIRCKKIAEEEKLAQKITSDVQVSRAGRCV